MSAKDDLKMRQAYPLKAKVHLSLMRIREFYEAQDGKVYAAWSGGKDSQVMLHLIRSIYPEVPAVFSNTGLEFPEIVAHAMSFPGVEVVRPKMSFKQVIEKYGFAVVSKKVARMVWDLLHETPGNLNTRNLRNTGITADGRSMPHMKLPTKWRFLLEAPFKVGYQCCNALKKEPLDTYARFSGRVPFMGMLAEEGSTRALAYERVGCNVIGTKKDRSTPLAFWTNQDILHYIQNEGLKICSVYGDIVEGQDGNLATTGESRTGCIWCLFGVQYDSKDGKLNRIQRLAVTHPQLHKYCTKTLGIGPVMDFLGLPWAIPEQPPTLPTQGTTEKGGGE
jgi:3'-phosphoadenosine 5'-phosphosulfate sulfotransferase (PAPS reductase)/FAD synthetase